MPQHPVTNIAEEHPSYMQMKIKWELVESLLGGSQAMRDKGILYLPLKPKEDFKKEYPERLKQTFLEPGFEKAITRTIALPFSRPVSVSKTGIEGIDLMEKDVDLSGSGLTDFAREVTLDAAAYGKTHLLTDFPSITPKVDDEGKTVKRSVEEEKQLKLRTTILHIKALDLFYWEVIRDSGRTELSEIRYKSEESIVNETTGISEVKIVTTRISTVEHVWQKFVDGDGGDSNTPSSQGEYSPSVIPLTIIYTSRTGFMTAKPPQYSLAEANLEHYQDGSDQKNIVSFARTGLHIFAGFQDKEIGKEIVMGGNNYIRTSEKEAKAYVVEHSGKAIEIGQNQLDKIKERMDRLGSEPLHERSGSIVATGVMINENRANSDLLAWIQAVETGLVEAYNFAAKIWLNVELPDDFKLNIYKDFQVPMSNQDANVIQAMRNSNDLSQKTYLNEMVRRNILDRGLDIDAEILAANQEAADRFAKDIEQMNSLTNDPGTTE